MEQRRGVFLVTAVLVIVGLIIFALSRRNGGPNGGGEGDKAVPAGSITVSVDPSSTQVPIGSNVSGHYNVSFDTKDASGAGIAWPYEWNIQLARGTDPPNFFGSAAAFQHGYSNPANPGAASGDFLLSTEGTAPGESIFMIGTLRAPPSNDEGQPMVVGSGQWPTIAADVADQGILITEGAGQGIAFRSRGLFRQGRR